MEIDNRKKQIIDAALNRFSHFGIAKTTMNEIAEDSSISKGNIYYYFSDKNALIKDVIHEILNKFEKEINPRLEKCTNTLESLQEVQQAKQEFLKKYYMLNLFEGMDCSSGHENVKHISDVTGTFGLKIIIKILEKGIASGELSIANLPEVAELYIQSNRGLFMVNQFYSSKKIIIDQELMKSIFHKQNELAKIFVKAYSN